MLQLTRIVPILVVIAVAALIFYLVAQVKFSPPRARKYLIVGFTWLCGIGMVVFGIASLYSILEGNMNVFDLMLSFFIAFAIGMVITRICHWRFMKNNPEFKFKATSTKGAGPIDGRKIQDAVMRVVQQYINSKMGKM